MGQLVESGSLFQSLEENVAVGLKTARKPPPRRRNVDWEEVPDSNPGVGSKFNSYGAAVTTPRFAGVASSAAGPVAVAGAWISLTADRATAKTMV